MTDREFENIYSSTREKLARVVRRYCRAESFDLDEDDVIQESLMALWELSEQGYPIRNATALLVTITKNICVQRLRRRHLEVERLDVCDISISEQESSADIPDEDSLKKYFRECLTESEYELMTMKAEQGMSYDEIAEATGKTKASVKMSISRGRRKLQGLLKKHFI